MMNWSSTDGRSWSITVGDNQATVWLIDEVFYGASILWSDKSSSLLPEFDDIKEVKKFCLELIERTVAYEAQQAQEAEEASAMFRESDDGMPA